MGRCLCVEVKAFSREYRIRVGFHFSLSPPTIVRMEVTLVMPGNPLMRVMILELPRHMKEPNTYLGQSIQ